ncbi:hypothetical protein [Glutamicibacter arilaitensis]|uniref:hypothetical protein n=1 Tax=Glutamicibacter arilaitensis TaxID=256701 RepID=UPI0015E189FE|nr:hypothetical protein [Glutamicibacter arilaitensis]
MRWHGYAATALVVVTAAFIVGDRMPSFDGRHLLMVAGAAWLVWSLCQPTKSTKH